MMNNHGHKDECGCARSSRLLSSNEQHDQDEFTFTNIIGFLDNYHPTRNQNRWAIIDGILERNLYKPTDNDLITIVFRASTANYEDKRYYVLEIVLEKYSDSFTKSFVHDHNYKQINPIMIADLYQNEYILELLKKYGFLLRS